MIFELEAKTDSLYMLTWILN